MRECRDRAQWREGCRLRQPRGVPARLVDRLTAWPLALRLWQLLPLPYGALWPLLWLANKKFLVGVVVAVFDEHGSVLLVHNTYGRHGRWGLPGGWLTSDETAAQGALRELYEETGFVGEIGTVVAVTGGPGPRSQLDVMYLARIAGGAFRPSAEIDRCQYVDPDALPADTIPQHRALIETARVALGSRG